MAENIQVDEAFLFKRFFELIQLNNRRKIMINRFLEEYPEHGLLCQSGYSSEIFRAVVKKDNVIIRKHLRLTVIALERVFNYGARFINTEKGWSDRFIITVFLYWLGCGASYRVTGASFGISRYTVRDIVHKCLKGFLSLKSSVIKYPAESEFEGICTKFNQRAGTTIFNRALGAIDGTHIPIDVPTLLRDQYMNRMSFTSINLQAVCSSSKEFLSICVGFPGSMHDEQVLKSSELFNLRNFPPPGYYLLGDSAYCCRTNPIAILTPYKRLQPLTARQKKFNELHSKARTVIESTFAALKMRWRSIFDKVLRLNLEHCVQTVAVACVMHNICLNDGFEIDEVLEDLKYEEVLIEDEDIAAAVMRDEIANNIQM
ncbi:protein ALP1-like [Teleopsis dalmanni]|uniref:protein ALP1-like n=1 Tax=Teleopsis dalmanni TaxID=139649 RepID=UPI0018CCA2E6|nr:protein ALP1-like [Teleopsis dalmanni]XP_037934174.1 protein ALP1-like [Teleopsis dalmanni]